MLSKSGRIEIKNQPWGNLKAFLDLKVWSWIWILLSSSCQSRWTEGQEWMLRSERCFSAQNMVWPFQIIHTIDHCIKSMLEGKYFLMLALDWQSPRAAAEKDIHMGMEKQPDPPSGWFLEVNSEIGVPSTRVSNGQKQKTFNIWGEEIGVCKLIFLYYAYVLIYIFLLKSKDIGNVILVWTWKE